MFILFSIYTHCPHHYVDEVSKPVLLVLVAVQRYISQDEKSLYWPLTLLLLAGSFSIIMILYMGAKRCAPYLNILGTLSSWVYVQNSILSLVSIYYIALRGSSRMRG